MCFYRFISLIWTVSKLLEKMVNKRLYWTPKETKYIHNYQFRFQINKSNINALKIITEDMYLAFNTHQDLLTSLDIEKAYGMVWPHRILDILQKQKMNGNILAYISNFLSVWIFSVKLDEIYSSYGVLQWSSLNVTLFIVVINQFPNIIQTSLKTIMFVNNSCIHYKRRNISISKALMKEAIETICKYEKCINFIFGPVKTKSILFSYKKKA